MSRRWKGTLLLLPFVALGSFKATDAMANFKCLPRASDDSLPGWIHVVDGQPIGEYVDPVVDEAGRPLTYRDDIAAIRMICWKDAERLFGVKAKFGVMATYMKPGPVEQMKAALAEVASHQQAYFAVHETYADDVGGLKGFEPDPRISFDLTATSEAWMATTRHAHYDNACHLSTFPSSQDESVCYSTDTWGF